MSLPDKPPWLMLIAAALYFPRQLGLTCCFGFVSVVPWA